MLSRTKITKAIDDLARPTLGVFHARDLPRHHLDGRHVRSRVRAGSVSMLLPRTFLNAPHGMSATFEQECMAGTLAGGHGAQVDGLAAASLRGWWNRHVDRIDVTLPDRSLHAAPERWRFRRASSGLWLPQPDDLVGPIHVACALQVILTAAATSDATPHQLAFIMSEAIRDGHVTMTELEQLVVDRRGWRGIAAVRSAVAMVRQGSWGTRCFTEDCYVSEFERAGLELPRVNQRGALGLVRDEPDFVWDEQRANVESDGAHHDHPSQREDDRQRDITAMGLGWRVLRVRARDFHRHRRKVMAAVLAFVHGAEVPVIPGTRVLAIG